jgi:hypothetical protein
LSGILSQRHQFHGGQHLVFQQAPAKGVQAEFGRQ